MVRLEQPAQVADRVQTPIRDRAAEDGGRDGCRALIVVGMVTPLVDELNISDAAEDLGVSTHTLRYYERAGLMVEAVDRAASSHRRFRASDLDWLRLIGRLRATGMPIRRIREYADFARSPQDTAADRLRLLVEHRDDVRARMRETEGHLDAIDLKIEACRNGCQNP